MKLKNNLIFEESGLTNYLNRIAKQRYYNPKNTKSKPKFKKSKQRGIMVSAATKAQFDAMGWFLRDYGINSAYTWQKVKNKGVNISKKYSKEAPRREAIRRYEIEYKTVVTRSKRKGNVTLEDYVNTFTRMYDINEKIKKYNKKYGKDVGLLGDTGLDYRGKYFLPKYYQTAKNVINEPFEKIINREWELLEKQASTILPTGWVKEWIAFASKKFDTGDFVKKVNRTSYVQNVFKYTPEHLQDIMYEILDEVSKDTQNEPLIVLMDELKNAGLLTHALYVKGKKTVNRIIESGKVK